MDTSFKSDKSDVNLSARSKKLPEGDFLSYIEQEVFKQPELEETSERYKQPSPNIKKDVFPTPKLEENGAERYKQPTPYITNSGSVSPQKSDNKFSSSSSYNNRESMEDSKDPVTIQSRDYSVTNLSSQLSYASPDLQEFAESPDLEKKTFLTQVKAGEEKPENLPWSLHDILFPGGKVAKLCKIPDQKNPNLRITEILKRFKLLDSYPVILLSGAESDSRSKLLIGLVRAAYNTDAVILDNGMKNGIEQACHKKKVKLIGVCPEDIVVYPTKNSNGDRLGELTPGHSHVFSLGKKGDKRSWNSVLSFKMEIIDRLRKGRSGPGSFACRVLCVCVGDSMNCLGEVEMILKAKWPFLVFENSVLGREISNHIRGMPSSLSDRTKQVITNGRVFIFPDSGTAEHLASAAHLHLTISL